MKKITSAAPFRSTSPLEHHQNINNTNKKYDYSLQKSPNSNNVIRKPLEVFNPLSPENVDYLVSKRLSDNNSIFEEHKDHATAKFPLESSIYNPKLLYNANTNRNSFTSSEQQENFIYPINNISNNNKTNPSKAYVNAMKALQLKIKALEENISEISQRSQEKEIALNEEILSLSTEINEKTRVFEGLERNLKEKLSLIEKDRNEYEKKFVVLNKEHEKLKVNYESLDKRLEEEFQNYLSEKSEIKAIAKLKEDRIEILEKENLIIKEEIEELRKSKQILQLDIMNNSEETQKIINELKEKNISFQKEKEAILMEFREKEIEMKRILDVERQEKLYLEKECKELKNLNERQENELEDSRFQLRQKENELVLLREKTKSLIKEKEALLLKESEMNKAIKNKDTLYKNINSNNDEIPEKNARIKKSNLNSNNNFYYTKTNENEEENLGSAKKNKSDEKFENEYQIYTIRSQKKNYLKNDMDTLIARIIQLEKELVKYIEKYKLLSGRLTEFDRETNESISIRKEMAEVNETIHRINQEIFELKKVEENLLDQP